MVTFRSVIIRSLVLTTVSRRIHTQGFLTINTDTIVCLNDPPVAHIPQQSDTLLSFRFHYHTFIHRATAIHYRYYQIVNSVELLIRGTDDVFYRIPDGTRSSTNAAQ